MAHTGFANENEAGAPGSIVEARLEIIDAVRPLTGRGPLVFPNARHAHRPMSENAIGYLLNPDAV